MTRQLIALLGPTASGKTAAAVAIARTLPVEVVSADSRQVRTGMRIGTAAPTDAELAAVPHHLVGIVVPDAEWTLAAFLERARAALEDIWGRGRLPLLLGGSGQYVWALLEGWRVPAIAPDPALRARLEAEAADRGGDALHARLATLDPVSGRAHRPAQRPAGDTRARDRGGNQRAGTAPGARAARLRLASRGHPMVARGAATGAPTPGWRRCTWPGWSRRRAR